MDIYWICQRKVEAGWLMKCSRSSVAPCFPSSAVCEKFSLWFALNWETSTTSFVPLKSKAAPAFTRSEATDCPRVASEWFHVWMLHTETLWCGVCRSGLFTHKHILLSCFTLLWILLVNKSRHFRIPACFYVLLFTSEFILLQCLFYKQISIIPVFTPGLQPQMLSVRAAETWTLFRGRVKTRSKLLQCNWDGSGISLRLPQDWDRLETNYMFKFSLRQI